MHADTRSHLGTAVASLGMHSTGIISSHATRKTYGGGTVVARIGTMDPPVPF